MDATSPAHPKRSLDAAAEATLDGSPNRERGTDSPHDPPPQDEHELATGATLDGAAAELGTPIVTVNPQPSLADWDRYELLRLLGQGGMGEVYQARDRTLGRIVALKFIRGGDSQLTARFMQEARAQSRVDHPGICKVYEVGEVQGRAFIAMQFVDGLSLQHACRSMSLLDKVQVMRDAAQALHAAHELGIIHREPKIQKSPSRNAACDASLEKARKEVASRT